MLKDFRDEVFDIVIQAGQSNSEGYGLGSATQPFIPCEDILYLNNDFSICEAHEHVNGNEIVGNFSLAFCTEYIKDGRLAPGRRLLVVRAAVGGTGFLDKRWGEADDLFLTMIEMTQTALSLNPNNKLVVLLWHQGETDAILRASTQTHFKNLSTLINMIRNKFDGESLPFVAGDFVPQWRQNNLRICEPVITAIKEVCAKIGNARFVETVGLQSNDQRVNNGDAIHFCREALNLLGIKYYKAFCEIKS